MCGIAGALTADTGRDVGPLITRLTAALVHRGPDGSGIHLACGRSIALGNRRLSIVDVAGGAQPMANEDERVWVVFNGGCTTISSCAASWSGLATASAPARTRKCWCTGGSNGARDSWSGSMACMHSGCSTAAPERRRCGSRAIRSV